MGYPLDNALYQWEEGHRRLRELTIQMYSTAVFQDPDLLDELKLTAEQRAKLVAIEKDAKKERLEISRAMSVKVPVIREQVAARAEALRNREMAQMLSVLNETQMAQWKAMQGPPLRRSVK